VVAIIALSAGKYWNWIWLDAAVGILGGLVILKWSYGLGKETALELLDVYAKDIEPSDLADFLADDNTRIQDLHVWKVGPETRICQVTLESKNPRGTEFFHKKIRSRFSIDHIVIEERAWSA